jgi:uncharacterized protein
MGSVMATAAAKLASAGHAQAPRTEMDPRWSAVVNRDPRADGKFVYAVRTSGVYCRPTCPSRRANPGNVAFYDTCQEAERAGFRACKRCRPGPAGTTAAAETASAGRKPALHRVDQYDWSSIGSDLNTFGCAVLKKLLTPDACRDIASLYAHEEHFRSHIHMARHGFGSGEYRYFKYPLPSLVGGLRASLYSRVVTVANDWNARMNIAARYPSEHSDYLKICHAAGQLRPTPLVLQYETGDFNCLHQDLYGDLAFPLQATILLSEPGRDFTGGEFVLTEQRPRMQSRVEVVRLEQGDAVIFAVHNRPVQSGKGAYRVNLRHGVSRVRSGRRYTLGIIFHDAK